MPVRIVVFGGGGHARVLIDALKLQGGVEIAGILDPDADLWKTEILGVPILGNDDELPGLMSSGVTHFAVGIAGVGPSLLRVNIYEAAQARGLLPKTVVHPSAIVSPFVTLGAGVQVLAGAIVNACAVLGDGVIVNSGAIVEHDAKIGAYAHIACGARLAGGVIVESGTFIGAGATVIQCVRIGANALVAAGAVVVGNVSPGARVGGVPARPIST